MLRQLELIAPQDNRRPRPALKNLDKAITHRRHCAFDGDDHNRFDEAAVDAPDPRRLVNFADAEVRRDCDGCVGSQSGVGAGNAGDVIGLGCRLDEWSNIDVGWRIDDRLFFVLEERLGHRGLGLGKDIIDVQR